MQSYGADFRLRGLVSATFSPDGSSLLVGSSGDPTARVFDLGSGREVQQLRIGSDPLTAVAFSPDGRFVIIGGWDGAAQLWDLSSGERARIFEGHSSYLEAVAFSPDGRFLLTGSKDQTARLWDVETGEELCQLISFRDGGWAVVDETGRFDASAGGEVEGLHWVLGLETISLVQLKQRYYDPGLAAKKLGFNPEPVRDVSALADPALFPAVEVGAIERLKDRTGFHVLMGSAADAVSYEATQYAQGLLTHALLQGMKGAALREDQFIDVSLLFQHAADEVPRLAANIGGIQRPLIAAPKGTSFDIGRLTAEHRKRIPLSAPKPMLLEPVFINRDEMFDDIELTPLVRNRLRESARAGSVRRGSALPAVYVDAKQLPGAVRASGTYSIDGDAVVLDLVLVRDGEKLARRAVSGSRAEVEALAERVVASIGEALAVID